LTGKKDPKS